MIYILEVIVFQFLFFGLYWTLKNETFYSYNRFYILSVSLLSYILPFAKFDYFNRTSISEKMINTLPTLFLNNEGIVHKANVNSIAWHWWYLLMLGSAIMCLVFILKLKKLWVLSKNPKSNYEKGIRIIELKNSQEAFSFFNSVFIGDKLQGKERIIILKHELMHVREKHSLDVLFFEIQRILFWFNPLVYINQKEVQSLHEYIVDQQMVQENGRQEYCNSMLTQLFKAPKLSFINTFYKQSLIKKRIAMLSKKESKSNAKLKYVFVVPVIMGMLFYTSCSTNKKVVTNLPSKVTPIETVTDGAENVPISAIQLSPIFPGCEESEDVKKCFDKSIYKFVAKNMDTEIAEKLGLTGIQKMNAVFTIDVNGNIVDTEVKGDYEELKNEFVRVIKALPVMEPGSQNGKKCNTLYQLPLVFRVHPKEK